ncbi:MAG TPA: S41 family peptidase [Thermomicrobiales bacterium]|nr:S41 family peptidase [Thermomicrobiales bacterium]
MSLYRRLSPAVRIFVVVALVLGFGMFAFSGGILTERYALSPRAPASGGTQVGALPSDVPPEARDQFADFFATWQLIQQEYYYKPVDQQKLAYGATRGMLATLGDDYTTYLEPVQQQGVREQMSGDYEGIGVYVETVDGRFTVAAPMKGAPADQAGLRPKDVILRVDGREVTGLPQGDVVKLVRGKAGTVVHLTVQRPGTPGTLDFAITRAAINIPSVTLRMLDGQIAYIDVTVFGDKTTAQLDGALQDARAAGAKGIILDLRNNGGGWVVAAQEMVGRFVAPSRGPALYEDRAHGAQAKLLLQTPTPAPTPGPGTPPAATPSAAPPTIDASGAEGEPIIASKDGLTVYDLPLVVLVNGGTASASEIVAGALQDYGRATLIGTLTFGKGSIQSVHDFKDGSSARITIAQWLTPKKRVIQKRGITPDIVVEQPKDGTDAQLARAEQFIKSAER